MTDAANEIKVIPEQLKLLSHSSSVLLHKCPRKFQIYRMLGKAAGADDGDHHLAFGDVVGKAIQNYLVHGDYERCTFQAFMDWTGDIFEENASADKDKKNFWHALNALDRFVDFRHTALVEYELVFIGDVPAIELGFSIQCADGFKYRGKLDALLRHRRTGELKVLECKTTKFRKVSEASYANSGQGLGYSLVVEAIAQMLGVDAGASFEVYYPVYKTLSYEWELFPFTKSHTDRALFIRNLLIDIAHISEFAAWGHFPMHGENCFDFFRNCEYFGMCGMKDENLLLNVKPVKDDSADYAFDFSLDDIIEAQLQLHASA